MYYGLATPLESIGSRNIGIRLPTCSQPFSPKASLCIEAPGQFFCPGASHLPENGWKKIGAPTLGWDVGALG